MIVVTAPTIYMNMSVCKGVFYVLHVFTKKYYIHTYHPRFIPEGLTEISQIFLRNAPRDTTKI
jgi:hypothetical protein